MLAGGATAAELPRLGDGAVGAVVEAAGEVAEAEADGEAGTAPAAPDTVEVASGDVTEGVTATLGDTEVAAGTAEFDDPV